MAKKKSSKQKAQSPQEFSSSPFKSLKGLPAFTEQKPSSEENTTRQEKDVAMKQTVADDQLSFADEMDSMGVQPLSGAVVEESAPVKNVAEMASRPPKLSREEHDRSAFLDAIGFIETAFHDEWPEDEPEKQAVPRRMKQLERGQLKPEDKLDLHGLTIEEAYPKVRFFLQDAVYQGFKAVLIITGKGLHSSEGPVLRQAVEKLLAQQREQVIEWGVAPRRYGGNGALVVFLRGLGSGN